NAEKSGAMKCAPRELALARSHIEFAKNELDQGQYSNAIAHVDIADPNARAALANSPPEKCAARAFVTPRVGDRDGDGILDDGDTVLDVDDFCPNTPGVVGGDRPGCPKKNMLVVVTAKEIRITQQIQFEFNKATIKGDISFKILDEIVQILKDNLKISLEVQG